MGGRIPQWLMAKEHLVSSNTIAKAWTDYKKQHGLGGLGWVHATEEQSVSFKEWFANRARPHHIDNKAHERLGAALGTMEGIAEVIGEIGIERVALRRGEEVPDWEKTVKIAIKHLKTFLKRIQKLRNNE